MTMSSRSVLLAASLIAVPAAGAWAQNSTPAGNYGSNQTMTTAPTKPGATNTTKPGATGKSVVPGSNSTVAGDTSNTATAKKSGSGSGTNGR